MVSCSVSTSGISRNRCSTCCDHLSSGMRRKQWCWQSCCSRAMFARRHCRCWCCCCCGWSRCHWPHSSWLGCWVWPSWPAGGSSLSWLGWHAGGAASLWAPCCQQEEEGDGYDWDGRVHCCCCCWCSCCC